MKDSLKFPAKFYFHQNAFVIVINTMVLYFVVLKNASPSSAPCLEYRLMRSVFMLISASMFMHIFFLPRGNMTIQIKQY